MDVMKMKNCASKDSYQQSKNATHRTSLAFFKMFGEWVAPVLFHYHRTLQCACLQSRECHLHNQHTTPKPGSQHGGGVILQLTDGPQVFPATPQRPLLCGLASCLGSRVACHCHVSLLDFSFGTLLWTFPVFYVLDHWVFPQILKIVVKCT